LLPSQQHKIFNDGDNPLKQELSLEKLANELAERAIPLRISVLCAFVQTIDRAIIPLI
jgi:hypothetical protein